MRERALLLMLFALGGCVSERYSVEEATPALAAQRAQRYCAQQAATAQLDGTQPRPDGDLNFYRCVDPGSVATP
jgi:hypothetical protein